MMDTPLEKNWPELYKQALFETDYDRLCFRIEEAEKAIQQRALELWNSQLYEARERRDLDAALHFLALLRAVALKTDAKLVSASPLS